MASSIVKPARLPADLPNPPRRVLLAVTGLKVAVVTETLHALARRDPPWLADEVHVITTGDGAAPALAELSARPGSALSNLCLDLGLPLCERRSGSALIRRGGRGFAPRAGCEPHRLRPALWLIDI